MVKTISGDLAAHLLQEVTTLARCVKITRRDGMVFAFTSHDTPITVGGVTYSATEGFQSTAVDTKSDFSVDNTDISGVFDDEAITVSDLRAGLFDFADVHLFLANWNAAQGPLKIRRGKLGEVVSSPQGWFTVELRGLTQLLSQQIVELYGPMCRADLFDGRCALDAADYTSLGHVTTVTDETTAIVTLDTLSSKYQANDGWFANGLIHWLTGENAGRSVEILTWSESTGTLGFHVPNSFPMTIGDTFSITPGCDKSLETCRDKFNNLLNRRGEGYLPGDDQVFYYPDPQQ